MGFYFDDIFHQHDIFTQSSPPTRYSPIESGEFDDFNHKSSLQENDPHTWPTAKPPKKRGYRHHASYEFLIKSAALGCELCMLFALKGSEVHNVESQEDDIPHGGRSLTGFSEALLQAEAEVGDEEKQIYVTGKIGDYRRNIRLGFSEIRLFCCGKICLDIGVFCYPDDRCYGTLISGRPLYSHRFKDVLSTMPWDWMYECLREHDCCPYPGDALLPSRVIDVGSRHGTEEPFILISENGARGSWVALSHCWGGNIPQKTTTLNLRERQQCLPLKDLPKTFYDAVLITRQLGFQYLWIDSLCILQDSPSDWHQESSSMRNVYKHAALTLAATVAANSSSGILGERLSKSNLYSIPLEYVSNRFDMQGTLHFRRYDEGLSRSALMPRGPLTTRAWTVQEVVLPPRTLHFGHYELAWGCNALFEIESDPNPDFYDGAMQSLSLQQRENVNSFSRNRGDDSRDLLVRWYKIISEYGVRSLTVLEDKLPAISGVAQEVSSLTLFKYRAGLWKEDLFLGLLWSFDGVGSRSSTYLAPSWSWASIAFDARSQKELHEPRCKPYYYANPAILITLHSEFNVEVIRCGVDAKGEDIHGRVSSGFLVLRGQCLPAICRPTNPQSSDSFLPNSFLRGCIVDVFLLDGNKYGNIPEGNIVCSVDGDNHHVSLDDARKKGLGPFSTLESEREGMTFGDVDDMIRLSSQIELDPESIFIQISKWSGRGDSPGAIFALLLEPSKSNPAEYQRRGIARIPLENGLSTIGWQRRTVTII